MPTLADLQDRFATPVNLPEERFEGMEETLVCDSRASMTPAQMVEQKLRYALRAPSAFAASQDGFKRFKPR